MTAQEHYGRVTVLKAPNGGAVPYGNSVLVHGSAATLIIDPSLAVDEAPVPADQVMISHAHEDHIAGLRQFTAPTFAHRADAAAVRSLETMLDAYGLEPDARVEVQRFLTEQYSLPPTREAAAVEDGHIFDLGDRTATVIHLPGHTPGHCGVLIEPDGFLYVADIDLTSFGPMYGDLESSVEEFLASLDLVDSIDARWYGTFHQKGVIEGRSAFRERLGVYRDKLLSRERELSALLVEPHTIAEIVAHRLVYRPHVEAPYVEAVERRTAQLHLERLLARGEVIAVEPGRYQRVR